MGKTLLLMANAERDFRELKSQLEAEDFLVHQVSKISDAISGFSKHQPEVVLMDATRNEVACLEICHVIKSNAGLKNCLVMIVSDHRGEASEIAAFRAGADDYLVKPVFPMALLERIRIRTHKSRDVITLQEGLNGRSNLHIDREAYSVHVDNELLNLSRKEFELLYLLASCPGKIFRREELFEKIWKKKHTMTDRTIDVHILRLRKKLGKKFIQTQKGVGYRFAIN